MPTSVTKSRRFNQDPSSRLSLAAYIALPMGIEARKWTLRDLFEDVQQGKGEWRPPHRPQMVFARLRFSLLRT